MFNEKNVIAITIIDRYANLLRVGATQSRIQFAGVDTEDARIILHYGTVEDNDKYTPVYELTTEACNALRIALEADLKTELDFSRAITLALYKSNQGILPLNISTAITSGMDEFSKTAFRHNMMAMWQVIHK